MQRSARDASRSVIAGSSGDGGLVWGPRRDFSAGHQDAVGAHADVHFDPGEHSRTKHFARIGEFGAHAQRAGLHVHGAVNEDKFTEFLVD